MNRIRECVVALARDAYRPEPFRKGVIAGLLSAVPFTVCMLLQEPLLAIFGSLAAVRLGMVDPGGAHAHRFRTLLAGMACVTISTFLGTYLAGGPLYYLPLVAILVFAFAYLAALGSEGIALSVLSLFLMVVSLGVPGDPYSRSAAVFLSTTFVVGALLLPWLLHPDRPARRAMAVALGSVADMAERLAALDPSAGAGDGRDLWGARTRAYLSLDMALQVLADGAAGVSGGGRRQLSLRQLMAAAAAARRMTRALATLAEHRPVLPQWTLDQIRLEADVLHRAGRDLSGLSLRLVPASGLDLRLPAMPVLPHVAADPSLPRAVTEAFADFRLAADQVRLTLGPKGRSHIPCQAADLLPQPGRISRLLPWAWPLLRANFTLNSTSLNHALRLTILIVVATGLVWHFRMDFGYWVMLTVVMVAKPAYGGTRKAVGARVLGTLIGAALAEAVLLGTNNFWILVLLALLFNCLSHAVITTNYALGVAILTPYVILKIAAALPDTDVAIPRLEATFIGSALIAASLLLWAPTRYHRYWAGIAGTLEGMQLVLCELASAAGAGRPPPPMNTPALARAHRIVRVELQNAEAVVTEVFLEPEGWHPNRRELRSVITDLQRLTWVLGALDNPKHMLAPSACVPAACALTASARLMLRIAAACRTLDRQRAATDAGTWPDNLQEQAGKVFELLDSLPDEVFKRFAAALRDLTEDLATLHRLRLATALKAQDDDPASARATSGRDTG